MLQWIEESANSMGIGTSLRINKTIGKGTTGFHLNHNHDYWQISLFSKRGILGFIRNLTLRHAEKLARRELALSTEGKKRYSEVQDSVLSLRARIKKDVADFVKLAEETYRKSHPDFEPGR